jgi:RNA polymerase sigma factor (sigma-70 family)
MGDANGVLRSVIVDRYDYLIARLERYLRSPDRARDALHDVYIHLEKSKEVAIVRNPVGLILTAAINRARNQIRADSRLATADDVEATFGNLVDDAPDPAKTAEARSDFLAFEKAFAELPPRRRGILLASLKDGLSSRDIAQRVGLSKRRVDAELKLAREHCARALLKYRAK